MPTITLLKINQRTEDNVLTVDTNIPNPIIIIDLLLTVAKTYVAHAGTKMELKKEAAIITNEHAVLT